MRGTNNIPVSFGTFRSNLISLRNRSISQTKYKPENFSLKSVEKDFREQDQRLKLLEQAEYTGVLKRGSQCNFTPDVSLHLNTAQDASVILPSEISVQDVDNNTGRMPMTT